MLFSFVMMIDAIRFNVCANYFQQYRDKNSLDWNLIDIVKKKVNLYIYEVNSMRPKQNGRYLPTMFSNAFSGMKCMIF